MIKDYYYAFIQYSLRRVPYRIESGHLMQLPKIARD